MIVENIHLNLLRWNSLVEKCPRGPEVPSLLLWEERREKRENPQGEKLPCHSLRYWQVPLIRHGVLPGSKKTLVVLWTVSIEHWVGETGGAKWHHFISDTSFWEVVPAAKVKLTMLWELVRSCQLLGNFFCGCLKSLVTTHVMHWLTRLWLDCPVVYSLVLGSPVVCTQKLDSTLFL